MDSDKRTKLYEFGVALTATVRDKNPKSEERVKECLRALGVTHDEAVNQLQELLSSHTNSGHHH